MNRIFLSLVSIAGVLVANTAQAQFTSDPANQMVLSGGTGDQVIPHWLQFPGGGYWVWYWNQSGSGYQDWITRINADGSSPSGWSPAGQVYFPDTQTSTTLPPAADVDVSGNAILAYINDAVSPAQLALQKVAPNGTLLFGTGITVTSGTQAVSNPGIVVDTDGNYVVSFTKNIGVLQSNGTTVTQKARCWYQKFSPSGTPIWANPVQMEPTWSFWDTNLPLSSGNLPHFAYGFQSFGLVKSDSGSVIVCMVSVNGVSGTRRIAVQKLDTNGAPLWNGGADVAITTANSMGFSQIPWFFSDTENGAIIGWYDGASSTFRARCQHVNSAGTLLFPAAGATTSTNANQLQQIPAFAYDPATHSTYAVTQENNSLQSIKGINVQRFDAAGNPAFGDGVVVVPMATAIGNTPQFCRIALTTGGVITSWFHAIDPSGSLQMEVLAAKVSNEGSLIWGPTVVNSTTSVAKGRLDMAPIAGGGVIDFYQSGAAGSSDVIISRINDDGTLGNPSAPCGTSDFDGDGDFGTDADIEAFFACLGGNCCATCYSGGADFNGDGDTGTDLDIESFFSVLGGGNCHY